MLKVWKSAKVKMMKDIFSETEFNYTPEELKKIKTLKTLIEGIKLN